MKKTIIVAMALIGSVVASAQSNFKKADKFVEGSVGYSKTEGQTSSYVVNPTAGYFLTNKVAVGATVGFGRDSEGTKTTILGAFGRCYFLNLGKSAKIYSQLGISNTNALDVNAFKTNVDLGVNYFVSEKFALTAGLADLITYTNVAGTSSFSIGWQGVSNPINQGRFGLLYRF